MPCNDYQNSNNNFLSHQQYNVRYQPYKYIFRLKCPWIDLYQLKVTSIRKNKSFLWMRVLYKPLEKCRLNCRRVLVSLLKNHFGVSNAQKGYVGHTDDLLTSIFGFCAFDYVWMYWLEIDFRGVHATPFFRLDYVLRMPADKMVRCALMALVSDSTQYPTEACPVTARALRCHILWQWRRIVQYGAPKWRRCREPALF